MAASDTYLNNHAAILRDLGRSQAEAKLQSGAAWGNAIGQIGQIAGNLPGQLADERRAKQQEAIWQANIDKFNQDRQEDQWLKDAMNSSVDPATGDIDERKLTENLNLLGAAELAPRALAPFREAKMAKVQLDNALMQGRVNEAEYSQQMAATLAPYAKAIVEAEGDPAVLAAALAAVRITHGPQMADGLRQRMAAEPAGVLPFVQSLIKPEEPQKSVQLGKDEGLWNPNTGTWDVERPEQEKPVLSLEQQLAAAVASRNGAEVSRIRNEMMRNSAATRAPERATFEWAKFPDGSIKLSTPQEIRKAQGQPVTAPRPNTEEEKKSVGFATQMAQAITILDELEAQLSADDLYRIQTLPQEKLIGWANRSSTSEAAKRYLRAFEQFTESRLRSVSGAAISDSEFARDRRTYAKQYGETDKLAADRKAARMSALDALQSRSGSLASTVKAPGAPGESGSGGFSVNAGGQIFSFPSQASLDAFKAKAGIR